MEEEIVCNRWKDLADELFMLSSSIFKNLLTKKGNYKHIKGNYYSEDPCVLKSYVFRKLHARTNERSAGCNKCLERKNQLYVICEM